MTNQITVDEIAKAIDRHQNPVVACSFGKDSMAVLHLARRAYPDIPVIFNNTKVEYPDTLRLKRQLVNDWNLNLIEAKPLDGWTFWDIVEKYGFPIGQRRGTSTTSKCCYYLKKKPMAHAIKKHNWDLILDGMTIFESRQRYLQLSKYIDNGGYRFNKKWKCHKLSPILDWTPADVWDYIEENNLPYNEYYDKTLNEIPQMTKRGIREKGYYRCLRVGCWACTVPMRYNPYHLIHLKQYYPKLHQLILKKGLAKFLIEHGKNTEIYRQLDVNWIIEHRPCYLDGVVV